MPTASRILRDGELIETGPAADFDRNKVVRAMVGRALTGEIYNRRRKAADLRKRGTQILSVRDVSMGSMVRNNSFSIFEGQITGIFGLVGSGRTETFKIVSGIYKRDFLRGGEIVFDGKPVRYNVPVQAVRDGIVYVTEDRKLEGFFETMSIAENFYSGPLAAGLTQAQLRVLRRDARDCRANGRSGSTSRPSTTMPASWSSRAATSRRW